MSNQEFVEYEFTYSKECRLGHVVAEDNAVKTGNKVRCRICLRKSQRAWYEAQKRKKAAAKRSA